MLEEPIDILTLLYHGKQFDYDSKHHHLKLTLMDEQPIIKRVHIIPANL